MSVYGELDPMVQHMAQFVFKAKREHITMVNIPNIAYPNRHIDIKIAHGSRDHVIVPDIVKIMLSPDIESTDKTRSIVKNVDRALVKKKVLMIGSKEIDTISNSDIYDTYKNLYLSEKKREEKLLQGIQTANGLKARTGAKKTDDMALAVTTRKMRSKRRLVKCLQYL